MAGVMHIGAGLVGLKSKTVEKVLVFQCFLDGSREPGDPSQTKSQAIRDNNQPKSKYKVFKKRKSHQQTLDGKCDAYRCGLAGAEKGKC